MTVQLWTTHFTRICIANLLLFISLYVLFPVLSIEMADRLGVPVAQTSLIFLFFIVGTFLIGPFHAYLVDAYKRKYVCMSSFSVMIAATVGYAFVRNITELIMLSTVQGVAFGMATTAGITLAIDITNATLRSLGNFNFAWTARLGMIVGVALGVWLYQFYGFSDLLTVSVVIGIAGILMVSGVYVPFRAPIVTTIYSCDRFLLLRGWVPALNMLLITFVLGLLIPLAHSFINDSALESLHTSVPFFVGTGAGFLVSLVLVRFYKKNDRPLHLIVLGLGLEWVALLMLNTDASIFLPSILLGLGLGLVLPEFLVLFVKLSQHCQRGTANTTHLLACESGIMLGIAATCYMDADTMLTTGRNVALLSLLFFVTITYPYYRKMKVRGSKVGN